MKNKSQVIPACIAALALCSTPVAAVAQSSSAPVPETESAVAVPAKAAAPATNNPSDRAFPFRGTVSATDEKAKTFTISGKEKSRVFKITDKTILTKGGVSATIKEVAVNEEVRGSYWKAADGSLEARIVKLGPKTETEKTATKKQSRKKTAKAELPFSSNNSASAKP